MALEEQNEERTEISPEVEPDRVRLWRGDDGALMHGGANGDVRVYPHLCFPWTSPSRYISLRDPEKNEVALLKDISDLDKDARQALEEVMKEARFAFLIIGIESARAEFELRIWRVRTRQGPRQFQTKLDEWPRPLPDGSLLIRDISGDLYHVENPGELDADSQRILWAFMD